MRRIILVVAMCALFLSLNTGVAAAATVTQCFGGFCSGFGNNEIINESPFNDNIFSHGKKAQVNAQRFSFDTDRVTGGAGRDRIDVADGDPFDSVSCGGGRDRVTANFGDAVKKSCEKVRFF